jgi:CheY-like chemotaxis protein
MAKILLVEDDNNLREIYEARLQAEGYTIVSAHDGEEALVVAKNEKPDLIISDVMMPKISGFEMLDILRNTDGLKEVKVVMLTALGQNDDQQRANKLGADRYLVKSQVTLEDIVKVAQELLNESDSEADAVVQAVTVPNQTTNSVAAIPFTPEPAQDGLPVQTAPTEEAPVVEEPLLQAPIDPQPVAEVAPAPVEPETPAVEVAAMPVTPEPAQDGLPVQTAPTEEAPVVEEPLLQAPIDPQPVAEVAPVVEEPLLQAPIDPQPVTEVAPAPVEPETPAVDSATQNLATDDKLMDEAVNNLTNIASTSTVVDTSHDTSDLPTEETTNKEEVTSDINVSSLTSPESEQETIVQESSEVESQIENFASSVSPQADMIATNQEPLTAEHEAITTETTTMMPVTSDESKPSEEHSTKIKINPSTESVTDDTSDEDAQSNDARAALAEMNSMPGKKVISPISSPEDKPDINVLLAQEEANQSIEATGIITTEQPTVDPNSIAL